MGERCALKILVLQVRLNSARLPQKAFLEIQPNKIFLNAVLEQLAFIPADYRILACPKEDVPLISKHLKQLEKQGWVLVGGAENDVLARVYQAVLEIVPEKNRTKDSLVLRATADNAFVLTEAANKLAEQALALRSDYACYTALPHGSGLEYIRLQALSTAFAQASDAYDREHVCPYIYKNPHLFRIHRPEIDIHLRHPELNLSVDTEEDLLRAKNLYARLGGPCALDEKIVKTAQKLSVQVGN